MATCHQAWSSGQRGKDQVNGGDLLTFPPYQGVPDCGFLLAKVEGRGYEGTQDPDALVLDWI